MENVEVLGLKYSPIAAYAEAIKEVEQAEQNFNYAEPEYVDSAIYQLQAAREKLGAIKNQIEKGKINAVHENFVKPLKKRKLNFAIHDTL